MKKVVESVKRFHNNESGMEALQTVVILAVASIILVGVYNMWDTKIKPEVINRVNTVIKTAK